jgi:hypothetical protein
MNGFAWLVNGVVIAGIAYLAFAMALAGWIAGLRKGQAVTLLPEQSTRTRNLWLQLALVAVSLAVYAAVIYLLWIPLPLVLPPCHLSPYNVPAVFAQYAPVVFTQYAPAICGRNVPPQGGETPVNRLSFRENL